MCPRVQSKVQFGRRIDQKLKWGCCYFLSSQGSVTGHEDYKERIWERLYAHVETEIFVVLLFEFIFYTFFCSFLTPFNLDNFAKFGKSEKKNQK